ncbi:hypothetical protein ACVXG9_28590 [Escherichia coli]
MATNSISGQRIEYTEIGETGGYKWNDTDSCNEVVRRGYASGVMVSGKVFYDGAPSISYTGHVAPNKPYARQAPLYNDGKKNGGMETLTHTGQDNIIF